MTDDLHFHPDAAFEYLMKQPKTVAGLGGSVSKVIGDELGSQAELTQGLPTWKGEVTLSADTSSITLTSKGKSLRLSAGDQLDEAAVRSWMKNPVDAALAPASTSEPTRVTFTTTLLSTGGNNCGVDIPDEVMTQLGGKRVPVKVTLGGTFTYSSTTAVMGGHNLVGVNAENRAASGYGPGDTLEVTLERDDAPRGVEVPHDLAAAMAAAPGAAEAWEKLAPSHRKEHARSITEAKAPETRARRVEKAIAKLLGEI